MGLKIWIAVAFVKIVIAPVATIIVVADIKHVRLAGLKFQRVQIRLHHFDRITALICLETLGVVG